ncbi:MAG: 50S ribosomal protein L40e [Candidatus Diapherotrites archaeon]|nr:50S ribosomal protein L40e [Candidatus Diapherotrites archaeon]
MSKVVGVPDRRLDVLICMKCNARNSIGRERCRKCNYKLRKKHKVSKKGR